MVTIKENLQQFKKLLTDGKQLSEESINDDIREYLKRVREVSPEYRFPGKFRLGQHPRHAPQKKALLFGNLSFSEGVVKRAMQNRTKTIFELCYATASSLKAQWRYHWLLTNQISQSTRIKHKVPLRSIIEKYLNNTDTYNEQQWLEYYAAHVEFDFINAANKRSGHVK